MKPTFPLIALLATTACGGMVSSSALAPDGGASCLQPTVMPLVVAAPGQEGASGFLEVPLDEVAPGLDPVVLASVQLRPSAGLSLASVEGARLTVADDGGGPSAVLAAGGARVEDGLSLALPASPVNIRGLAPGGVLRLHLELAGASPASVTVDVCVHPPSHDGVF